MTPATRPKRLPRRIWFLIAVGALFVAGSIALQLLTPVANDVTLPRGTTLSAAPQGALALSQWLEAEGYAITRVREFPLPGAGSGLDALVVITPNTEPYTNEDAASVRAFVEGGGTLILATEHDDGTAALREALGIVVENGRATGGNAALTPTATPTGPTLARPPVRTIALDSPATVVPVVPNDAAFLPRAASANGTVVATVTRGAGRVHIITGAYPLTNAGLPAADNLALVQNLLAGLPAGARIGFDEYHHGYGLGNTIADRALRSPWGWAFLYLALLAFVAFALGGRRFGRPLPAPPVPPQAPAVFARALGDRWRERGARAFAQAHIAQRLKRDLAAPFGLDPALDDEAFCAALVARRPDLAAVAALLADLRAGAKSDAALRARAARAAALTDAATAGRSNGARAAP